MTAASVFSPLRGGALERRPLFTEGLTENSPSNNGAFGQPKGPPPFFSPCQARGQRGFFFFFPSSGGRKWTRIRDDPFSPAHRRREQTNPPPVFFLFFFFDEKRSQKPSGLWVYFFFPSLTVRRKFAAMASLLPFLLARAWPLPQDCLSPLHFWKVGAEGTITSLLGKENECECAELPSSSDEGMDEKLTRRFRLLALSLPPSFLFPLVKKAQVENTFFLGHGPFSRKNFNFPLPQW